MVFIIISIKKKKINFLELIIILMKKRSDKLSLFSFLKNDNLFCTEI